MGSRRIAGIVYATITAIVVAFQIALALGAPWGSFAMGGAFPGQFPPALRISAMIQAAILLAFAAIVLARSGVAIHRWGRASRWIVWVVVAFAAVSLVLNLITPSAGERIIWAPVALTQLVTSLLVATGPTVPNTAAQQLAGADLASPASKTLRFRPLTNLHGSATMNPRGLVKYLSNCFLLILPALIINLVWASRLPPMWQFAAFWKDIPTWMAAVENSTRLVVNLLPLLMVLQISTKSQRLGLAIYLVGMIVYLLAWLLMVYLPDSAWSTSAIGATATAWTTLIWLVGIGLIGDRLSIRVPYHPWVYLAFSALFVAFHTAHALLVYLRIP